MPISPAVRRVLAVLGLLLLPLAVYWNTIHHRYGFRDDYSILRESHEEPGKILRVCTGMGRPLYGLLIEPTFARLDRLADLQRPRLLSAALLGLAGTLVYLLLLRLGWEGTMAGLVGALIMLLPGAQVMVSWAIAWPTVLAVVFAVAGFGCGEQALARESTAVKRLMWWIGSLGFVAGSALIYQSSTLFYLVPLAAGVFGRSSRSVGENAGWIFRHCATLGCGLVLALAIVLVIFAAGGVEVSARVAVSSNVTETLRWFWHFPLPNALALFALEGNGAEAAAYAAAIFVVTILLFAGVIVTGRSSGWSRVALIVAVMLAFPLIAYGVNLVSTERLATYRTLLPLSALVLVFVAASLRNVAGEKVTAAILSALLLLAGWTARRQAYDLFAVPQSQEFALMEEGARKVDSRKPSRIFVITPMLAEAPADRRVGDEFGSLSSNSDWTPKEMFAAALKEVFGNTPISYVCESGQTLPRDGDYDVVVDLSRLREFRAK